MSDESKLLLEAISKENVRLVNELNELQSRLNRMTDAYNEAIRLKDSSLRAHVAASVLCGLIAVNGTERLQVRSATRVADKLLAHLASTVPGGDEEPAE